MNLKKSNTLFVVLSIVLAFLLLGLGVFTYRDYQSDREVIGALEQEKTVIKNELSELIVKYDSVQFENAHMRKILEETKDKLKTLRIKMELEKDTEVRSLLRYRKQIELLKAEQLRLLRLNDSLLRVNDEMRDSLTERNMALNEANDLTTILKEENSRLASIVDKNEKVIQKYKNDYPIAIKKIACEALRVKSNGKKILTEKAKRAEQIRVCFSITTESKEEVDVLMYLKILNPKGERIGSPVVVSNSEEAFLYSDKKKIVLNKEGKACFIVEVNKKKMEAGIYKAELYNQHKLVGFSDFELF